MPLETENLPGNSLSVIYADGITLIRDVDTNDTALAATGFIAKATFEGYLPSKAGQTVNPTYGVVSLRPVDAVQLFFAGTGSDDNTVNYLVEAVHPVYTIGSDGFKSTISGYFTWPVAQGVATLSTLTIGAAFATALGGSTASGDRLADTITQTITDGSNSVQCDSVSSPGSVSANMGAASIIVRTAGATHLRVTTDRATGATQAFVFGRRVFPLFQG